MKWDPSQGWGLWLCQGRKSKLYQLWRLQPKLKQRQRCQVKTQRDQPSIIRADGNWRATPQCFINCLREPDTTTERGRKRSCRGKRSRGRVRTLSSCPPKTEFLTWSHQVSLKCNVERFLLLNDTDGSRAKFSYRKIKLHFWPVEAKHEIISKVYKL